MAGESFDLAVVASLSSDDGVTELIDRGLVREQAPRHGSVPARAHARGAVRRPPVDVPAHAAPRARRGARGGRRAEPRRRAALARRARAASARARRCCARPPTPRAVHAYCDAADAYRQALELWPDGGDEDRRAAALEDYAACCQLAGALTDAARAWRELADRRARPPRGRHRPAPPRRGARAQGRPRAWPSRARDGRRRRVRGHGPAGRGRGRADRDRQPAPAVGAPRRGGRARPGAPARRRPRRPHRPAHPRARASRAWRAPSSTTTRAGLEIVRHGLALALEHDLTAVAAELYQRLSVDALRVGGLPPRRGGARHRARRCARRARTRTSIGACVVVHGLRAARARRVVAGDARCAAR